MFSFIALNAFKDASLKMTYGVHCSVMFCTVTHMHTTITGTNRFHKCYPYRIANTVHSEILQILL